MIAAPNPAALLIYVLCAATGIVLERRLPFNSLLKRVLMIYAIGAGQLMIAIELLSLGKALTGWNVIFINAALSGVAIFLVRRPPAPDRLPWRELRARALNEFHLARRDLPTLALLVVAAAFFMVASVVAILIVPFNDSYHFEMPRFWLQHQSVYPFLSHNPRITTISFLSEAIALPGFIAFRNDQPIVVATFVAAIFAIAVIYSLARRIGACPVTSLAAAALSIGYVTFATSISGAAAEMLLSGVFFGASLMCLMDAWRNDSSNRAPAAELGASVFFFVMSCGAKNPTTLVAPFYLLFLALAVLRLENQIRAKLISAVVCAGFIALLSSGVAWNYGSNKLYYGSKGLPPLMKSTISRTYAPRDIWTRLCRGAVLVLYDTIWVPRSARDTYKRVCESTLKILGAKSSLSEDDAYFSFKSEPMKGLGPLAVAFFIPALVVGCARSVRAWRVEPKPLPAPALNVITLTFLSIASFIMCHLILRWQFIGMVRLMFPLVIAGAPLTALLLVNRFVRAAALVALLLVSTIFSVYWAGIVSRHLGRTDGAFFKTIAKLQNDRATPLQFQWKAQPARETVWREDYRSREVFDLILSGLQQPCTIGFIGNENSECLYLFGKHSQNRIVSLVDASEPDRIIERRTDDLDYIVAADQFDAAKKWAEAHGFEQIFTCSSPKGEVALVFKPKSR